MRHLAVLAVVLSSLYLAHAKCCAGGIWSAWAASGRCSDSCGSCGKITYTRRCISARNGCPCSGPVRKTKNCNLMPCKYPRDSCCGKMDAIVTGGKVICGPQPAEPKEAPGPAPDTPCTAPPSPPPPRPRTTKRITKATTKPTTTDRTHTPGLPVGQSSEEPTTITASPPCPADWSYCPGASHCYLWTDGEYTQPEAQSKCRELGGSLASVGSTAATQCLIDYVEQISKEATRAWIGLVDTAGNRKHTADCTCWKWLDGSPYNYENFAPGQPNNSEGKEWCTEIYLPRSGQPAGKWNDELCDAYKRPALCSVPANGTNGLHPTTRVSTPGTGEPTKSVPSKVSTPPAGRTTAGTSKPSSPQSRPTSAVLTQSTTGFITTHTATTRRPACTDGWAYCPAAARCYKLIDGGYTQLEAHSQCREVGGNLATIDSDKATQCVLEYTAQTSPNAVSAWIGLVDPTENSKHTANCTCWKWLDGSSYNYENFKPGEPNNNGGKEWCTVVDLRQPRTSAGKWLDWGCDGLSKPALCSVPAKGTKGPLLTRVEPTRAAAKTTASGTPKSSTREASTTS